MIHIVIWGAGGQMGKRLIKLIGKDPELSLVGAIDITGHSGLSKDAGLYHELPETGVPLAETYSPPPAMENGVVMDFSLKGGLSNASIWAQRHGWALLSGTTALTNEDKTALASAAQTIPTLHAPNFSIGVQLLLQLIAKAAASLPEHFDSTIIETHHNQKKDKPSGTALAFQDRIKTSGTNRSVDIGAVRGGSIVGEHTIRFVSDLEDVSFSHRAFNRDVFAAGALQAGRWLVTQPPGQYALADMLGIS